MNDFLFAVGTSFGRVFVATFATLSLGILAAPNVDATAALSVAALAASIAAGLRAVQVLIPRLSFGEFVRQPWAGWADSFVRAFLAAGVVSVTGWLAAPDLATWRAAGVAAVVGALSAGFRAVQGTVTLGDSPKPPVGV